MHHSLFSAQRHAHIQIALLNRLLANTSCVDRRDELLFLLQLAEGTEQGHVQKEPPLLKSQRQQACCYCLRQQTLKLRVMLCSIKGSWVGDQLFEQVIPVGIC